MMSKVKVMHALQHEQAAIEARAKKRAFLRTVERCGKAYLASRIVHVAYATHLQWLVEDPEYAAEYEAATYRCKLRLIEKYETECDRRAIDGWDEPVYQGGALVGVKRKFSDTLAIFRLKRLDPAYRENHQIMIASQVNVDQNGSQVRVIEDGDWYANAGRLDADGLGSEAAAEPTADLD